MDEINKRDALDALIKIAIEVLNAAIRSGPARAVQPG